MQQPRVRNEAASEEGDVAEDDESVVLALRYGAEVAVRGSSSGRWLCVVPSTAEDAVRFNAAVQGIGLGAREERFELCSARRGTAQDGPVRYGDAVSLRSRLARQKCLGCDEKTRTVRFTRNLIGDAERWELASTTRRRGELVCSGEAVLLRSLSSRSSGGYLAGDASVVFADEAPLESMVWVMTLAGAPRWATWHDDRPYLSGRFILDPTRGDDMEEKHDIVEDLLSSLLGLEGGSVRVAASTDLNSLKFVVNGGEESAATLAQWCLGCGESYVRSREFARSRRRYEYGRVSHALAAAMSELLHEYTAFVAQLETKKLRLQQLWYLLQPALSTLKQIEAVAKLSSRLRGGELLGALHQHAMDESVDSQSVSRVLAGAAAKPYLDTLRDWLRLGVLEDPFNEFLVAEETQMDRTEVATDYNAAYWESRFYARPEHAFSTLLKSKSQQIVTTGKYVQVVRELEELEPTDDEFFDYEALIEESGKCGLVIQRAYDSAARRLHFLLKDREQISAKLDFMRKYFLASQGDFLVNLLELASTELRKRTEDLSEARVSQLLQLAMSLSAGGDNNNAGVIALRFSKAPHGVLEQLDAIHTHADPTMAERVFLASNSHIGLTGAETFSLDVTVEWPASIVLSRRAIVKYQLIFRQVFWLKHVERELLETWSTQNAALRTLSKSPNKAAAKRSRRRLGRAFALRHRMLHFSQNLSHYVMFEVLEARYATLLERLNASKTVDDTTSAHDAYLDLALKECLLTNHDLLKLLAALLHACAHFASATRRLFLGLVPTAPDDSANDALRARHLEDAAQLPSTEELVDELASSWAEIFARFIDRLHAECHLNSSFVNLYNRLRD